MKRLKKNLKYEQAEQNQAPWKEKPQSATAVRPVRSDGINEEPNRCQMGPLKDGLWIKSCTEKGKKRRFGFSVSFQPAKLPSWTSWQSVQKQPGLLIPSGTLPEVVWRESNPKSGSKSHGFTLSHRETPAGYMILYISPQSLSPGASP